jgi:GNAT superfamily N-acetyltransferase
MEQRIDKALQDDFAHIYGASATHPICQIMIDVIGRYAPLLREHREKHQRDDNLVIGNSSNIFGISMERVQSLGLHHVLLDDFQAISTFIKEEYDREFGPLIELEGDRNLNMHKGHVVVADFDSGDDCDLQLCLSEYFEWKNSGIARASHIYKRECGWDFAPGEAGVWLLYCLLTEGTGSKEHFFYTANLAGFVVLNDRDDDGEYESLSHIWTAKAARRKGIATKLIQQACTLFPLEHVEGPLTKKGESLINEVWVDKSMRQGKI